MKIDVPFWNETVANLSLMALGSSAPEILLSLMMTLSDIGAEPPELGPSTIVGSAAFNLLIISGLSILAVGEEVKKVEMYAVFIVTSAFSIVAYLWLLVVLDMNTEGVVDLAEGWITLAMFVVLMGVAFAIDKMTQYLDDAKKT